MPDVRELLTRNMRDVFGNRDEKARLDAMSEIYTENIEFADADGPFVGYDEVNRRATELLARDPADFVFTEDGIPYSASDIAALAWAWGPAGAPIVRGLDVLYLRDGKIEAVHTLLAKSL